MRKLILLLLMIKLNVLFAQDSMRVAQDKRMNEFLNAVGKKESNGRYDVVSKKGYLGKYQFSHNTIKGLGIKVTRSEFLKSKKIQDCAMKRYMSYNKSILRKEIEEFVGKTIKGVRITESGILAAAHLGGAGAIRRFLRGGIDFADGNGVRISHYLSKFGDYILDQ